MQVGIQTTATVKNPPGAFRRAIPTAMAIIPVSLLFGVLASRADWSMLDIALISLLGFSGSGQFALLPLAASGAGFFTMLLITASINSRYLPIAYMSSQYLPKKPGQRAVMAHMLGDEAYATEHEQDHPSAVLVIRSTIFITWVLAAVVGAQVGTWLPRSWIGPDINLGYPASVVLMHLSVTQLRARVLLHGQRLISWALAIGLCVIAALLLIKLLGLMYFWIPSILVATAILARVKG